MMSKIKIFNDPIYGLVSFPFEFIYDLIDHPFIQRLRRIRQLGLSSLVYPGATHSRFHHALGAMHLCDRSINTLRHKGIEISDEEHEASLCAALLHDIGHGPYSHSLEGELIDQHHEDLTLLLMEWLNEQFDGRLSLTIKIFKGNYHRPFLSQLISSQIDVDRMDYLNRDSFYTGVAEGVIGYDRIIKMMNVVRGELVIEEKGIYSIEKFLFSRHFMYHQVYHHHAALAADHMLKLFFKRYKKYTDIKKSAVDHLVNSKYASIRERLRIFLQIDDSDIMMLLKREMTSDDYYLRFIANGLINRKIFAIKIKGKPFDKQDHDRIILESFSEGDLTKIQFSDLVNQGTEKRSIYKFQDEIKILKKDSNQVVTFGSLSRLKTYNSEKDIYFITYPKYLKQINFK